ncbi:MAG: glycosyl hydrolase family 28-related protein [Deltaproteobacteria bacterium]|nr:glycosyl hydrolase family 28-related protein [Deltaproteobacteria bacterium]
MNTRKISFRMMLLLAGFLYIWLFSYAQAADQVVVIPMGSGGKPLQNVVTVAKNNGKFTDPVAAMNSITDASATNPYLIFIAPGQYTITTPLIMKEYVDVAGGGENVTLLTGAINGPSDETSAIVKGANHATMSNLTITHTGGFNCSLGIYTTGLDNTARLQHVNVISSGAANNIGVLNSSSSPIMTEMNITVSGESVGNYGVWNKNSSSPIMTDVNVLLPAPGGSNCFGVANESSSPVMIGGNLSVVSVAGISAGVSNHSSSPVMTGVKIVVSGGFFANSGVENYSSSPVMTGVNIVASGVKSQGVYNSSIDAGSNSVKIRRSTLSGDTAGLASNAGSSVTVISQSTIINGVSGGEYTCVACDDNAGHLLNTDCTVPDLK